MAKSACKCKESECEECPEWIFTFADLVMLMMGFFVILWVLKPSAEPEKKEEGAVLPIELLAKIREAFDYLPDPHEQRSGRRLHDPEEAGEPATAEEPGQRRRNQQDAPRRRRHRSGSRNDPPGKAGDRRHRA